jgi:hypothetical protein
MTKTTTSILLALSALALGACGGGSAAPIALAPGFALTQATGNAGGLRDASGMGAGCLGNIPESPQHVLNVSGALPNLTIMVNGGSSDTTLVVHLPDGSYRCNDDTDGLNPVVVGPVGAGTVEVFVGSYSHDSTAAAYTIGFSPDAAATPTAVLH